MSYSSFKCRKMFIALLPGHTFAIWVGRVIGVIFTSNQSTSVKRRAFKMLHTAYAVLLNLCFLIVAVYWIGIVLPLLSSNIRYSISDIVGQGIAVIFAVLLVLYRVYLLMIAAPLSSFMKKLDAGTYFASKYSGFKFWATSLVSVYFASMTCDAVYYNDVVAQLIKDSLWMPNMGNVLLDHLVSFVVWSVAIVRFVPFALAITTLDRLLDLLESFATRVQSIVAVVSASRFGERRMDRESSGQLPLEGNISEIEHLLSELQKIQELFDRYDQLLGPLIFLLLSNSTIGCVDAISDVVCPKIIELESRQSFIQWVALFNHLLPFTLLNIGYLAKCRINCLRISLKQEIAAAMSRSRIEGLMTLYRNIEELKWKMSAAGFFIVDRSLMTGIASAALTYTILLFQIQGVLKAGTDDDDQLHEQLLRLLKILNKTQFAHELEH